MVAIVETADHLGRGLLPREIEEELLDVLNLERSLLEPILLQEVFHGRNAHYSRITYLVACLYPWLAVCIRGCPNPCESVFIRGCLIRVNPCSSVAA
jgi:hypothetical protein